MTNKTNRSVEEIVEILWDLHKKEFAGKSEGRYKISASGLRAITGRRRLEGSVIESIIDEAYEQDLIVVELEDYFAVIKSSILEGYRNVPKRVITTLSN